MVKTVDLQKIFKTEEVKTWALNNVSIDMFAGRIINLFDGQVVAEVNL